jgi:hypothetical protein
MLLTEVVGPERNSPARSSRPARRLSLRGCRSRRSRSASRASAFGRQQQRGADCVHDRFPRATGELCLGRHAPMVDHPLACRTVARDAPGEATARLPESTSRLHGEGLVVYPEARSPGLHRSPVPAPGSSTCDHLHLGGRSAGRRDEHLASGIRVPHRERRWHTIQRDTLDRAASRERRADMQRTGES